MIDAIQATRGVILRASAMERTAALRSGRLRAAFQALAALLCGVCVDLLWPLPNIVRGAILGAVLWRAAAGIRAPAGRERGLEAGARALEAQRPELENALINAVQFDTVLAGGELPPEDGRRALMRREMARTEALAPSLANEQPGAARAGREGRRLAWLAVGSAITLLLFPRTWRFEAPRYFLFWQDRPPFTLTDFRVQPGDLRIRPGVSVTVRAKLGGRLPENVTLALRDSRGRETRSPLAPDESGAYSQTLEDVRADTCYWIEAETGRSDRYLIGVDQAPRVRAMHAIIYAPAYAKRRPETVNVGGRGIDGLFGTRVVLEVEATRPLGGGALAVSEAGGAVSQVSLLPVPNHPDRASGEFTIRRSGEFRLSLRGRDGQSTHDAARGPVTLLRDEKPVVYVNRPGQNAMVTPSMRVSIQVEAEDDVAVERVELHTAINETAEGSRILPAIPGSRHTEVGAELDLADLGVRPGDVIQYYATAFDSDPGNPHVADSDRYWVWVVSDDDYRRILERQRGREEMAAEYRQLTGGLEELARSQRALANEIRDSRQPFSGLAKRQGALSGEGKALAAAMRKLASRPDQYDVEAGLKRKLNDAAGQVEQAVLSMQRAAAGPPQSRSAQAQRAASQLERAARQKGEAVNRAVEALDAAAPIYDDAARLRQVAESQADLARQAQSAAAQPAAGEFGPARQRDLASRQAQLREELQQVQRDLQEHSERARTSMPAASESARELAGAIDRLQVTGTMEVAEREFARQGAANAPREGAEQADRASRALQTLLKTAGQCQSGAKRGLDGQCRSGLGHGAGSTLQQLARMGGSRAGNRGLASGSGQGGGQGQGAASGQGTVPAPRPGARPGNGGAADMSRQAMALTLQRPQQGGGLRKQDRKAGITGAASLPLAARDVEHVESASRAPAAGRDPSDSRYPPEYRRLVRDYFQAVAEGR